MQTLYALTTLDDDNSTRIDLASMLLDDKLEQVLDIFTSSLHLLLSVAGYAEIDASRRSARYLKQTDEAEVDTTLAHSAFVRFMEDNLSYADRIKRRHLERFVPVEWVRKIYQQLIKSAEYTRYAAQGGDDQVRDRAIMLFAWNQIVLGDDGLTSQFMDEWPDWEDDAELISMLLQNFLNHKSKADFNELLARNKRTYAHDLLRTTLEKEAVCMERIIPKLNNWDKERVALIDLILLKMGVCEFLFFPTIPTKVTINEFIDIAKQYSTPQSGQFVNGVLDNILKELLKENKIQKIERNG